MRAVLVLTGVLQVAAVASSSSSAAPASSASPTASSTAGTRHDASDDEVGRETVVRGQREGPARMPTDDLHDGPTALLGVPGLALARDGGPLSPSRPLLRGLGGARLGVDVAGVAFVDPLSGDVDAGLLPYALGVAVVDVAGGGALGGQLSLRPAPGDRLQLVVGELGTLQGSARLSVPVSAGRVTGAMSGGTTRGDFPFVAVDAGGAPSASLVRSNNDQRRLTGAVVADLAGALPSLLGEAPVAGRLSAHVVATGAVHEGGIPGFSTAPLALRGERVRGALGGVVGWRRQHDHVAVAVDGLADRRRVIDGSRVDEVGAAGGGAGATLGTRLLDEGDRVIDGAVVTRGAQVLVPGFALRREGHARLQLDARAPLNPDLVLGLAVGGGVGVVDDRDAIATGTTEGTHWLPTGHLEASVMGDGARLALGVRHAARAPTLDERFAPAGFIAGNKGLRPERVTDLELRGAVDVGDAVAVDAAAFVSHLDDGIVLVNRNAFEVAPENTGPARRAGLELGLRARPLALVVLEQAATLLWSEVEATGAPLPTAPPLSLRSRARVGTDDAWVSGTVTGRGSAPSTIFGTLGSGAFVLVDLAARLPIGAGLAITVAVDNAFDVLHARDQNLLPLPGRLASVGLEVRP